MCSHTNVAATLGLTAAGARDLQRDGDAAAYSDAGLASRLRLKAHPALVDAVRRMATALVWSLAGKLSATEYARFHGVVVDILLPQATSDERRELLQVVHRRSWCLCASYSSVVVG